MGNVHEDRCFEPLLARPNARMGDDMCRDWGVRAANIHAGRELIDSAFKQGVANPARSAHSLAEVRRLLLQLRAEPVADGKSWP